jgi:hypothetical protein
LALEGQPVQLHFFRGQLIGYPQAMFENRLNNIEPEVPGAANELRKRGLR